MKPARTLPGARWDCGQCGACCRGFRFGPLAPALIADLEGAGVREWWAPAAEGWYDALPGPAGQPAHFLRNREDGRCVFLQDDQRCAIHARLGADRKPPFCREFPLLAVQTRTHTAVIARAECAGLHHSFGTGQPLAPQAEEALALALALPRVVPVISHTPDAVVLFGNVGVSPESWQTLEDILLERIDGQEPWQAAATLRRVLSQATGRDLPPFPHHDVAWQSLLGRLTAPLEAGAADDRLPAWQRAPLAQGLAWCRLALQPDRPTQPLLPDGAAYAGLLLRNFLFARQFAAFSSLTEGTGAFLLGLLLAQRVADAPLSAADLAATHTPWLRLMDHPLLQRSLRLQGQALHALFLSA